MRRTWIARPGAAISPRNLWPVGSLVAGVAMCTGCLPPLDVMEQPVASVDVVPQATAIHVGDTTHLAATLWNAGGRLVSGVAVAWSSADPAIAKVNEDGTVVGVAQGSTAITARSEGQNGVGAVSVRPPAPVASVEISSVVTSIPVGDELRMVATLQDSAGVVVQGRELIWRSSDSAIASVTQAGLVRGVGRGAVEISATSEGKTATLSMSVTSPVLVGAGDIADCYSTPSVTAARATASLLDNIRGTVFTVGDNAYWSGTSTEYANCYGPTWGRHKLRTWPAPGNHEYLTPGGAGYFGYFGIRAGDPAKGYYSYDLADWHIIVINSEADHSVGSPQEKWMRADLGAHPTRCTLAYWHRPRFSSGSDGSQPDMQPIWQAAFDSAVDVVISGHDHMYERFAPQDGAGLRDSLRGVREFVVGTGGKTLHSVNAPLRASEVLNNTTFGVLKLILHPGRYEWAFVPVVGQTFQDSGNGFCH